MGKKRPAVREKRGESPVLFWIAVVFWLAVWQGVSRLIRNPVLFAGPYETLLALRGLVLTGGFWASIGASLLRILGGFLAGAVLGTVLAFAAYHRPVLGAFLRPFVTACKSVPVASFTIMLLIWFGSKALAFFVSLIVVLPVLFLAVYEGLKNQDRGLREMAEVFRIPLASRLRYIELPEIRAGLLSGIQVGIGMAFKSGVAAEVIGQPLLSVGNNLYQSKIYLETAELFAWTAVIVVLCYLCEKLFVGAAKILLGEGKAPSRKGGSDDN